MVSATTAPSSECVSCFTALAPGSRTKEGVLYPKSYNHRQIPTLNCEVNLQRYDKPFVVHCCTAITGSDTAPTLYDIDKGSIIEYIYIYIYIYNCYL